MSKGSINRYNQLFAGYANGTVRHIDSASETAVTLTPDEQNVQVDVTSADVTITLPPVGEARGLLYFIECLGTGNNLVVQDQDDTILATDYASGNIQLDHGYVAVLNIAGRIWYEVTKDPS